MAADALVRIFVEAPSGQRFEAQIAPETPLKQVAADFFESQNWPLQDQHGRGQRAVVELVNPQDPGQTKRLDGDSPLGDAGVRDGNVLRVFPESIAGAETVDERARLVALIADHNDLRALAGLDPHIRFETNRDYAPDRYALRFSYPSFIELPPGSQEPTVGERHEAEIRLGPGYPREAPIVRWKTAIFHPNIASPGGQVCLGVLRDRYLPGLGLARLVLMLAEMIRWRNFDAYNAFNREAAVWASDPEHWNQIRALGGHPLQGPIEQLIKTLGEEGRARIRFTPVPAGG